MPREVLHSVDDVVLGSISRLLRIDVDRPENAPAEQLAIVQRVPVATNEEDARERRVRVEPGNDDAFQDPPIRKVHSEMYADPRAEVRDPSHPDLDGGRRVSGDRGESRMYTVVSYAPKMTDVIVVGSGASGVNAAAPLVDTGLSVMLDFGNEDRHYAPLIPSRPFEGNPPDRPGTAPVFPRRPFRGHSLRPGARRNPSASWHSTQT
jgi:hypothetical protein